MQICSRLLGNQEIRLSRPQVFPLGDVSSQSSCCHMPIIFDDILSRLRWTEAYVSNTCKPSKARPDPQKQVLYPSARLNCMLYILRLDLQEYLVGDLSN